MRISKPADLARLVKTSRQAQGRTQQDVADAAGITRQSVARIERGHGGVSFDTVILMFDYLGIRLDGTSTVEAPTDVRHSHLPRIRIPEGLIARAAEGIDASSITQPTLRQFDPAAIGDVLRRSIDASGLATQFQKSPNALTDQATRAALRSAIEAGDPESRITADKPSPALHESEDRVKE